MTAPGRPGAVASPAPTSPRPEGACPAAASDLAVDRFINVGDAERGDPEHLGGVQHRHPPRTTGLLPVGDQQEHATTDAFDSPRERAPDHDRHRRIREERGAVAVELGLLFPVLMLIVLAIIGFGLLYNAQITLQGAAREGARVHALGSGDPVGVTQSAAGGLNVGVSVSPAGACVHGTPASVTATHDYSFNFMAFTVDRTLSATAVMRCERGTT